MLSSGPIVLTSWIIALTTRSVAALYIVRIIQGIAFAIPFTVTAMYIAEIADPKLRGQLGSYFQVFFYLGSLYSYVTGPYLDYQTYLYMACIPSIIFLITYAFVPESPYYLLMVNREEAAFKSLSWLRAGEDIEKEFAEIKESVQENMTSSGSWKDLIATRKDRVAFCIVVLICIVKYSNGMTCIVIYVTQTLAEGGELVFTSDQVTILLALILIVTTLCASFVADRVGRKPLLMISTIGSTIFHSITAVYYYLDSKTTMDVSSYVWISHMSLIGYCIITNVGLGPLMMTIQAEYFPSHTRAKGGAIIVVIASFVSFLNIKQYQLVSDIFGTYMNFVIFAAISLVGAILFPIVVHETAGKSLGQIQKSLDASKVQKFEA